MDKIEILFSLLRCELKGVPVNAEMIESIDDDTISLLLSISNAHDIAYIVASALHKISKFENNADSIELRNKAIQAVYRYEILNNELQEISQALGKAEIPFVPLKGAVVRNYYPEPWMRTSCDIDILIKRDDMAKVISILKKELNYCMDTKCNYHDVSLYSQSGVHIELHFSINENNPKFDKVLSRVWEYVTPLNKNNSCCKLENEFFLFYFIAHAAYHFLDGGCGIRTLIDLSFIEDAIEYDEQLLFSLLAEAGLTKFYENLRRLSRVWLCSEVHTSDTKQMEEYIIRGGVYGTICNHIAVRRNKTGGRLKYAFGKIFIPYDKMKKIYPFLEKHMWLTPFMQIYRWFKIICTGRTQRSIRELRVNAALTEEKVGDIKNLLDRLELR